MPSLFRERTWILEDKEPLVRFRQQRGWRKDLLAPDVLIAGSSSRPQGVRLGWLALSTCPVRID
jgi:hypothetical protein